MKSMLLFALLRSNRIPFSLALCVYERGCRGVRVYTCVRVCVYGHHYHVHRYTRPIAKVKVHVDGCTRAAAAAAPVSPIFVRQFLSKL